MAQDTPRHCRNLVLYEVYVRNHGPNGTFADVEADLPRIRAMGVDVVWFMPIHPIGKVNKKGSLGCPYSVADYRQVNPEYGTRADFARLIKRAHALGLKVMIDVVYNHTAHDSVLAQERPDWFYRDAEGRPVTTVPDCSDVVDLKHPNLALADYLIETLQMWVGLGVDGFRCDVASLLPLDFWLQARAAVKEVRDDFIWLAESVHASWVAERRAAGLPMLSDGELYRAFDLSFDHDIFPIWQAAAVGKVPVARYLEMLRFQDCVYPANFVKMRCVENHDQPRIMALAPSQAQALAWTAFQAFNKGALLFYAGQESGARHTPSLFDVDRVAWEDYALQPFLTRLAQLKKDPAQVEGEFVLLEAEPAVQAAWIHLGGRLYGVFNTVAAMGSAAVHLPDGIYTDLLSERSVKVHKGKMLLPESAVVLRTPQAMAEHEPVYSILLDYRH
ncbi:MAG: alpha-amylase [Anaerolineae bacterium]|nr:MAG: alpha-amylase [Anaerolineae bacterium]